MLGQLGQDEVRADAIAGIAHYRRRRFVAARLDAQHQHDMKLAGRYGEDNAALPCCLEREDPGYSERVRTHPVKYNVHPR
jgi:hypothetical protein